MVEISCICFVHTCLKDKLLKEKKNPPVSASQASVGLIAHEATSFSHGLLLETFASFFSSFAQKILVMLLQFQGYFPNPFFWGGVVLGLSQFFFNLRLFL